jgi:hypothetical protein
MDSIKDHKFKIPDTIDINLQALLKRIDNEIQMFGCIIKQDQFSDHKWQYIVKDRIFTVRDMYGSGLGINIVKQRYKFEEIIEVNETSQ